MVPTEAVNTKMAEGMEVLETSSILSETEDSLTQLQEQTEFLEKAMKEKLSLVQKSEGGEECKHHKVKLNEIMSQYLGFKRKLVSKTMHQLVLESLAKGEPPENISSEPELMKNSAQEVRESKENMTEVINRLTGKLEVAQEMYSMLEARQKELAVELDPIIKKKALVEEYLASCEQVEEDGNLNQANSDLEQIRAVIDGSQSELSHLNLEVDQMKLSIEALVTVLNKAKAKQAEHVAQREKENKELLNFEARCRDQLANLQAYSGIADYKFDDNTVQLILSHPTGNVPVTCASGGQAVEQLRQLRLAVHVQCTGEGAMLMSAEVDESTLEIDDIVQVAKEKNDFAFLVDEIRSRWISQVPLMSEVDMLRERFAVDWIHSENKMRVICGEDAHIICTLLVEPNYPSNGSVQLVSVEGLKDGQSQENITPPGDRPSLTQWLEHLQHCFNRVHEDMVT